jgi:hypothetical protein
MTTVAMVSRTRMLVVWIAVTFVAFALVLGVLLALGNVHGKVHVDLAGAARRAAEAAPGQAIADGCTEVWTGRGLNDKWHTAANWNPPKVPGPADTACIPAGAHVVVDRDVTVKGIVNHGTLDLRSGNVRADNVTTG